MVCLAEPSSYADWLSDVFYCSTQDSDRVQLHLSLRFADEMHDWTNPSSRNSDANTDQVVYELNYECIMYCLLNQVCVVGGYCSSIPVADKQSFHRFSVRMKT